MKAKPVPMDHGTKPKGILAAVLEQARNPNSGVEMCHKQGKTAIYLAEDRTTLMEHRPGGQPRVLRQIK